MKLTKAFWGALFVSGALGASTAVAATDMRRQELSRVHSDRGPSSDDTSLAPGVPGITQDSLGGATERDAIVIEESLADNGYDPGTVDGMIDSHTRAAIREFQSDHDLAVTGSIDRNTEEMLGLASNRSGESHRPRS